MTAVKPPRRPAGVGGIDDVQRPPIVRSVVGSFVIETPAGASRESDREVHARLAHLASLPRPEPKHAPPRPKKRRAKKVAPPPVPHLATGERQPNHFDERLAAPFGREADGIPYGTRTVLVHGPAFPEPESTAVAVPEAPGAPPSRRRGAAARMRAAEARGGVATVEAPSMPDVPPEPSLLERRLAAGRAALDLTEAAMDCLQGLYHEKVLEFVAATVQYVVSGAVREKALRKYEIDARLCAAALDIKKNRLGCHEHVPAVAAWYFARHPELTP